MHQSYRVAIVISPYGGSTIHPTTVCAARSDGGILRCLEIYEQRMDPHDAAIGTFMNAILNVYTREQVTVYIEGIYSSLEADRLAAYVLHNWRLRVPLNAHGHHEYRWSIHDRERMRALGACHRSPGDFARLSVDEATLMIGWALEMTQAAEHHM
jgi:hypothetical protein